MKNYLFLVTKMKVIINWSFDVNTIVFASLTILRSAISHPPLHYHALMVAQSLEKDIVVINFMPVFEPIGFSKNYSTLKQFQYPVLGVI